MDWKPISSAPKNGRRCYVGRQGFDTALAFWGVEYMRPRWIIREQHGSPTEDVPYEPTHWAPLDEAPSP